MKASWGIAAVAALVCGACNGFPSAEPGEPAHAASPEEYLTYQPSPVTEPLHVGNQSFVFVAAPVTDIPVSAFSGVQGAARTLPWDRAPFDALFVEGADRRLHPYKLVY